MSFYKCCCQHESCQRQNHLALTIVHHKEGPTTYDSRAVGTIGILAVMRTGGNQLLHAGGRNPMITPDQLKQ